MVRDANDDRGEQPDDQESLNLSVDLADDSSEPMNCRARCTASGRTSIACAASSRGV